MMDWLYLQLADSAFPTGGFAHSGGFEAALQLGEIQGATGVEKFLGDALWQIGHSSLLLATAMHTHKMHLTELDQLCDIFLTNHVSNRVSRTQGRTFLATCVRSFDAKELVALRSEVERSESFFHFGPLFGAILGALGVALEPMQRLLLHGALRAVVSAAIR